MICASPPELLKSQLDSVSLELHKIEIFPLDFLILVRKNSFTG